MAVVVGVPVLGRLVVELRFSIRLLLAFEVCLMLKQIVSSCGIVSPSKIEVSSGICGFWLLL